MCVAKWFGLGSSNNNAALQLAQQQQQQAQAAVASANLDTEQSRLAAENQMRKAASAYGFASTLFGGSGSSQPQLGYKTLFGA
jgi:hypothetical protein